MNPRIRLARALLSLGEFLQTLPVVIMRPDDLVEFSRQNYSRPGLAGWADSEVVDAGLYEEELRLLEYALPPGDMLLLGVGGGREAIPLAQMGFRVTGVDFVPGMVEQAVKNAARRGLQIEGLVQEISRLDAPAGAYDVVWLSSVAYSFVPTRARRIEMVRRIAGALKPGGCFLFQFQIDTRPPAPRAAWRLRRLAAALTLGNLKSEEGDMLWGGAEFIHAFRSCEEVQAELEAGGLRAVGFFPGKNAARCSAVFRR